MLEGSQLSRLNLQLIAWLCTGDKSHLDYYSQNSKHASSGSIGLDMAIDVVCLSTLRQKAEAINKANLGWAEFDLIICKIYFETLRNLPFDFGESDFAGRAAAALQQFLDSCPPSDMQLSPQYEALWVKYSCYR